MESYDPTKTGCFAIGVDTGHGDWKGVHPTHLDGYYINVHVQFKYHPHRTGSVASNVIPNRVLLHSQQCISTVSVLQYTRAPVPHVACTDLLDVHRISSKINGFSSFFLPGHNKVTTYYKFSDLNSPMRVEVRKLDNWIVEVRKLSHPAPPAWSYQRRTLETNVAKATFASVWVNLLTS